MKKIVVYSIVSLLCMNAISQTDAEVSYPGLREANLQKAKAKQEESRKKIAASLADVKTMPATVVKNQGMTGTCWCFSTTSLVESQCIKNNLGDFDISDMFSVRNTYIEKAKNYVLRQGKTQFGEGGLGHDLINAIDKYGAVPESVYSGLKPGNSQHNHTKLVDTLKKYVDSVIKNKQISEDWINGYVNILNSELDTPPTSFKHNGKDYTPKTFATEVLKFNKKDYVYLTSFTHHPYYEKFVLEVPDNFSNGLYYNLPLAELLAVTKEALTKNYSVLWDADVSNDGFQQALGRAVYLDKSDMRNVKKADIFGGDYKEGEWNEKQRQKLFESLITQDDHLMHIVGLGKDKKGKTIFEVKNSWGDVGPNGGFILVTEPYFAINTISLVVPKASLSKAMLDKLGIK